MAKITIPSIFGSPTSKKRTKPLQQKSEDSLAIGPRPSSIPPLSPRSKSVRTPPSAKLRAQLQQLRPHSVISRSDSNASSPRVEYDEGGKKEANLVKEEKGSLGYFRNDKNVDVKEGNAKNGRPTAGSPHQNKEEKAASNSGNGQSVEVKALHTRDGRHTPSSPYHDSEETPELLLVLQEVRRKREAAERKEWLERWEGFADTLGSNIDLSLGTPNRDVREDKKKELGKARSSNWLAERPKPQTRSPSDEKGHGVSERQKAIARLPIEEQYSPMRKGKSTVSLPLIGEESPLERKHPMARATTEETRGWESFTEERLVISKGKRNYTPSERQAALSRLPVEERRKLSESLDSEKQNGDATKANGRSGKTTPTLEGDAPSTIYFSPRTLRTYVTLSSTTKNNFELSPAPKRSTRAPPSRFQITPGPRSSSRSFSDTSHSPLTTKSTLPLQSAKSRLLLQGSRNSLIPRLAVPEEPTGDTNAQEVVAQWQTRRETLWYDSDEEEVSYAERMKLCAIRSVL